MGAVEEEMEIEDRVKSHGQQLSNMQEILSQILTMHKTKDAPEKTKETPQSSRKKRAKGKETREDRRNISGHHMERKKVISAENHCMTIEKAVLAFILAARKLRPYFQGHQVTILSNLPLKKILRGMDVSGRMTKWAVELSVHDIAYAPRPSINGQVLADFFA
ncbi:unnamed protein product [Linum trigynum]|uniref:Reverse transcriptase RNase H-like domain-containing protein n=1 Tax=Linum trigynum TaxID=586398 RepID=A0AAV2CRJ9_9ROSI